MCDDDYNRCSSSIYSKWNACASIHYRISGVCSMKTKRNQMKKIVSPKRTSGDWRVMWGPPSPAINSNGNDNNRKCVLCSVFQHHSTWLGTLYRVNAMKTEIRQPKNNKHTLDIVSGTDSAVFRLMCSTTWQIAYTYTKTTRQQKN